MASFSCQPERRGVLVLLHLHSIFADRVTREKLCMLRVSKRYKMDELALLLAFFCIPVHQNSSARYTQGEI